MIGNRIVQNLTIPWRNVASLGLGKRIRLVLVKESCNVSTGVGKFRERL